MDGVRLDEHDAGSLLAAATVDQLDALIDAGKITGGMIPKVRGCQSAVRQGVHRVHILNGTIPHPILLEIFTDKGIGTMIMPDGEAQA